MDCSVCKRSITARQTPVCASCVQASLYKPRVDQVQAILSNEKAHTHVEAVVRPGNDGVLAALPEDADWDAITAGISTQSHGRVKAEKDGIELRIESISDKARELQQQIEEHKRYVAEQKQLHQSRRDDIASERHKLAKRRTQALEAVHTDIKRAKRHLEKMHTRTADAREYLCKEVAMLCGLQRSKDKKGRSEFYLAGLPIPNLKDLNSLNGRFRGDKLGRLEGKSVAETHELVSASLDNVCLFLGICCYYLSVRLPAEIVLPSVDFPHSALMQREASYKAGELRYPGIGSNNSSPAQSRMLSAVGERGKPRLLQLHKQLTQLQTQDHKTYGLFLEGAMLLAYDVAWLCRTQGVVDGTPSFDDVCDLGRNLYSLAGQRARPSLERRTTATSNKTDAGTSTVQFGRFSHASAAQSLAGHEGSAMFAPDAWRVSVTTLTDKLKAYLRNEAARSEWHIIDETEWDDVLEHEQVVMVGGASVMKRPDNAKGPAMSVMTVSPHDGADDSSERKTSETSKARGSSGWTKLRGRGGDA